MGWIGCYNGFSCFLFSLHALLARTGLGSDTAVVSILKRPKKIRVVLGLFTPASAVVLVAYSKSLSCICLSFCLFIPLYPALRGLFWRLSDD